MVTYCRKSGSNKHMVLTLPARSSFDIIARHKGLGDGIGCLLPPKARAGSTCEALANFVISGNNEAELRIGEILMNGPCFRDSEVMRNVIDRRESDYMSRFSGYTMKDLETMSDEEFEAILWPPETTPQEVANTLITDRKFGGVAIEQAQKYGDRILPLLKTVSDNFMKLDNRNALWVAEVLATIHSPLALRMSQELVGSDRVLQHLVGIIGLAGNGGIGHFEHDLMVPIKILVHGATAICEYRDYDEGNYRDATYLELAVIALGKTRSPEALPYLTAVLNAQKLPSTFNTHCVHAKACEAIQEIADPAGADILRACLRDSTFRAICYAFRALCRLGESKDAITLAIRRITPDIKGQWNELIIRELEEITGQHFGFAQQAWQHWWDEEAETWELKHSPL